MILIMFIIILKFNLILFLEKIITHFFEIVKENLGNISKLCFIFVIFVFMYL